MPHLAPAQTRRSRNTISPPVGKRPRGAIDQRQIQPLLFHALLEAKAHVDRDIDHDAGIGLGKTLQDVRQQPFADILRRAEPHDAAEFRHDEAGNSLVGERQDVAGVGQQQLAVLGQSHRTRITHEKRRAELFLELLDLHGNRGRRAEHGFSGGRKIACFRNGDKGSEDVIVEQRYRAAKGYAHRPIFQFF